MHRRQVLGAALAAAALGGVIPGGTAGAQPGDDASDTPGASVQTVLLPTGDQVRMLPNGAFGILPADGREDIGFLFVPAADGSGDTIAVPQDRVDELRSGTEDPRRYNISGLAADGQVAAADADASLLEHYAGLPPTTAAADAAAATLTVTVRDRSGAVPDDSFVSWYEDDGDGSGVLEFDAKGTAAVDLEPGGYTFTHMVWTEATDTAHGEIAYGISHVVVEDGGTELLLDSAEGAPVTVEVERPDAEMLSYGSAVMHIAPDGTGHSAMVFNDPDVDPYLMPQPDDMPEHDFGFQYQPTLVSPEGDREPYMYNLAFAQFGGYPESTAFSVADDDLAAVATDYRGLGKAVEGYTCNAGDHAVEPVGLPICKLIPTSFPSERLELFSADPMINWRNAIEGGLYNEDGYLVDGFQEITETVFAPGASERTFPRGPLTAGPSAAVLYSENGITRLETAVSLGASMNDEDVQLLGYTGDAALIFDDQKLDQFIEFDPLSGFGFDLNGLAAGRYTLAVDGTRANTVGPLASASAVDWTFDLDPAAITPDEYRILPLPTVSLLADDVAGGWTDACEQELTLELRDASGEPVTAESMTFEVSYNDGRTWTEVALDHDGAGATATLEHPWRARYVSTRLTATDTSGTEVAQTTIRAYGLR